MGERAEIGNGKIGRSVIVVRFFVAYSSPRKTRGGGGAKIDLIFIARTDIKLTPNICCLGIFKILPRLYY